MWAKLYYIICIIIWYLLYLAKYSKSAAIRFWFGTGVIGNRPFQFPNIAEMFHKGRPYSGLISIQCNTMHKYQREHKSKHKKNVDIEQ